MRDVGMDIRDVPAAVREAVARDISERDRSLNDAVEEILATRYGLPWESSNYPHTGASPDSDQWMLRVSPRLRDVIKQHAESSGNTQRGLVILALELHYGLPTSSPRKRGPTIDPAIVAEARRRHAEGESLRSLALEFRSRGIVVKRETLAKAIRA